MIVCHCRAVNHTTVLDAIGDGAIDVEAIAATCGAGAVCGGCRPTVQSLLAGDDVAPSEQALGRPRRARSPRGSIQVAPLG
jgi:bacterioferritin-associated ferredoxin